MRPFLRNHQGFTLMEMLIVVAIIGVLVAVAIPMFGSQLEKSREAVDLANVRAAYADVLTASMLGQTAETVKVVKLKQGQDNWQSIDPVNIGGITHRKGDGDTANWKGNPTAGGECKVTYEESVGVCLDWTGGGGSQPQRPNIDFGEKIHENSAILKFRAKNQTSSQFEIDSRCPNSVMVPEVQKTLSENSLLNYGTWAYLADNKNKQACLFWTSVNTNDVGKKKTIPVIVSKKVGENKEVFYISETETATRPSPKGSYVAIAEHITNANGFNKYTTGTKYDTLEEAYQAYEKLLNTEEKYSQYRDTLPK